MKLQEFVSETLREIIAGVKEAQASAQDNGALVNAAENRARDKDKHVSIRVGPGREITVPIRDIDFDVAVTTSDTSETQAGGGIMVAGFGLGAKGKSDTLNSCVSRVKFTVPLALPVNKPE
jgi:hypothetical protein